MSKQKGNENRNAYKHVYLHVYIHVYFYIILLASARQFACRVPHLRIIHPPRVLLCPAILVHVIIHFTIAVYFDNVFITKL